MNDKDINEIIEVVTEEAEKLIKNRPPRNLWSNSEEVIKNWKSTGLLDGVTEDHYFELSKRLGEAAKILFDTCPPDNTPEKYKHEELSGFILPIIVRIYQRLFSKTPSSQWLLTDFTKFKQDHEELLLHLKRSSYYGIGGEAEFSALYCDEIVSKILYPEPKPILFKYKDQEKTGFVYQESDLQYYVSEGKNVGGAQMWLINKEDLIKWFDSVEEWFNYKK